MTRRRGEGAATAFVAAEPRGRVDGAIFRPRAAQSALDAGTDMVPLCPWRADRAARRCVA